MNNEIVKNGLGQQIFEAVVPLKLKFHVYSNDGKMDVEEARRQVLHQLEAGNWDFDNMLVDLPGEQQVEVESVEARKL